MHCLYLVTCMDIMRYLTYGFCFFFVFSSQWSFIRGHFILFYFLVKESLFRQASEHRFSIIKEFRVLLVQISFFLCLSGHRISVTNEFHVLSVNISFH